MIYTIIIGALAGYLAGHIMHGRGFGALGNIILGIFGGIVGKVLFAFVGLGPSNLIGDIIAGVVGALILFAVFGEAKRRKRAR